MFKRLKENAGKGKRARVRDLLTFNDYKEPGNFNPAFLTLPLKKRVENMKNMHNKSDKLKIAALHLDNPYAMSSIADKIVTATEHGKEKTILRQIERFALGCEAIFESARQTFSQNKLTEIFVLRAAPHYGLTKNLHELYYIRESMFQTLAVLERFHKVSGAWRQIRQKCNRF